MTDDARDFDPEDAYDAGDPFPVRLAILARIIDSLRSDPAPRYETRRRIARELIERLEDELADAGVTLGELRDRLAVI